MIKRNWGIAFLLGMLLSSVLWADDGGAKTATGNDVASSQRLGLTVSGGVSLGSYQAGVTWAILSALRRLNQNHDGEDFEHYPGNVELTTFTGASAGNINAVLGAIHWCGGDAFEPPENSLLFRIWMRTGWEQLFSLNQSSSPQRMYVDSIFSRDLFVGGASDESSGMPSTLYETHKDLIEDALKAPSAHEDRNCSVNLGLTMTAVKSTQMSVAPNMDAVVNRVVTYFNLGRSQEEGTGKDIFVFRQSPLKEKDSDDLRKMGVVAILSDEEDGLIDIKEVMDAGLASSAFPVAFAPVRLTYWVKSSDQNKLVKKNGYFIDGGLFDNHPTALALDIQNLSHEDAKSRKLIYVDDMALREADGMAAPARRHAMQKSPTNAIDRIKDFTFDTINSARTYERQTMARYMSVDDLKTLNVSSRFADVTGDNLGAFAAFLGRPLREHDFYVGIYDGLQEVAEVYLCADSSKKEGGEKSDAADDVKRYSAEKARCVQREVNSLSHLLGLEDSISGSYIFALSQAEFSGDFTEKTPRNGANEREQLLVAILNGMLKQYRLDSMAGSESRHEKKCQRGGSLAKEACSQGVTELLDDIRDSDGFKTLDEEYGRSPDNKKPGYCPKNWSLYPSEPAYVSRLDASLVPYPKEILVRRDTCFLDKTFISLVEDPTRGFDAIQRDLVIQTYRVAQKANADLKEVVTGGAAILEYQKKTELSGFVWRNHTWPDYQFDYGDQSNTAGSILRLALPHELSGNISAGGYEAVYRPAYYCRPSTMAICPNSVAITFPITAYGRSRPQDQPTNYFGAGLGIQYRKDSFFLESTELSAQYLQDYSNRGANAMSYELGFTVLAGRLRFAYRYVQAPDAEWMGQRGSNLIISLADFPGTLYWAFRENN